MAKSYFAILGVSSNASHNEIRTAYRRLAKELHPDRFGGGTMPFKEIQEAYSVLGDAQKRMEYERSLSKLQTINRERNILRTEPEPLIPEQKPVNLGEISLVRSFQTYRPSFDEIFEWLWDNFPNINWPKSGRVQDLTLEVPLTKDQALRGGTAKVMIPVHATCPMCHGSGDIGLYECSRCAGEGAISGEKPVAIAFSPGLNRDHAVVIPLDRFGIRNVHATVLFRITDMD